MPIAAALLRGSTPGTWSRLINNGWAKESRTRRAGLDGYGWVKKAISLRGSDPEMEFAAALITFSGSERDRNDHVDKAMAGANTDPLLAQNLASYFNRRTIAER